VVHGGVGGVSVVRPVAGWASSRGLIYGSCRRLSSFLQRADWLWNNLLFSPYPGLFPGGGERLGHEGLHSSHVRPRLKWVEPYLNFPVCLHGVGRDVSTLRRGTISVYLLKVGLCMCKLFFRVEILYMDIINIIKCFSHPSQSHMKASSGGKQNCTRVWQYFCMRRWYKNNVKKHNKQAVICNTNQKNAQYL
jgi:hypothetical protein